MEKSAVVIALPMPANSQPSLEDMKLVSRSKGKYLKVKRTLNFTSPSLLGQWEDEVQRHSPTLKVVRHHTTAKMKIAELAEADIFVSSATFKKGKGVYDIV